MSLQAMVWALELELTDPLAKLVLLALANEASPTGEHAFPSQQTIAGTVPCGIATVQRKIKLLERDGLIVRGDQTLVERYRADRRPVVWDLNMPGRTAHHSDAPSGGTAHQGAPARPISGPSRVMDNPRTQDLTQPRARGGGSGSTRASGPVAPEVIHQIADDVREQLRRNRPTQEAEDVPADHPD